MPNITDYAESMLLTVKEEPVNPVDSLILSQFVYFHFPAEIKGISDWRGVKLSELFRAEFFKRMFFDMLDIESSKRLLTAMAASPRYRNAVIKGFSEHTDCKAEKQFAAICVQFNDETCYVAFRGTDSSIIGWKEDFNMAFQSPVPSQIDALAYLKEAAKHCKGDLYVGGHSKGGNLAVYASAYAETETKNRIRRVYSHDGPGFLKNMLESEAFASVRGKLDKTVPQSSFVGMLLEEHEVYRVIKSSKTSGIMQHDPFTWEVEDNDFTSVRSLGTRAKFIDKTMNNWIVSMSVEERKELVGRIFGWIDGENIKNTAEFEAKAKNLLKSVKSEYKKDEKTRAIIDKNFKSILSFGIKTVSERRKKNKEKNTEEN